MSRPRIFTDKERKQRAQDAAKPFIKAYREAHKKQGLCRVCSNPARLVRPYPDYCEHHAKVHKARIDRGNSLRALKSKSENTHDRLVDRHSGEEPPEASASF